MRLWVVDKCNVRLLIEINDVVAIGDHQRVVVEYRSGVIGCHWTEEGKSGQLPITQLAINRRSVSFNMVITLITALIALVYLLITVSPCHRQAQPPTPH